MVKLELSKDQSWVVLKALEIMVSDKGLELFRKDFPNADEDRLAADVTGVIDQIAKQHPELNQ